MYYIIWKGQRIEGTYAELSARMRGMVGVPIEKD
jgi:hypothetical protein